MRGRKPIDKVTLFSIALIIAVGGLVYELILGTTASYLQGDSITSFSLSIGTMLFGMGLGSLAVVRFQANSMVNFIWAELLLSLLGGNSVVLLFAAYSLSSFFWPLFLLLSVTIGFLIGLEIPLVFAMAKEDGAENNVSFLSKVMALDYLGALLGSIVFPFFLLPSLGLSRAAYAIALLNLAIVFFVLWRVDVIRRQRKIIYVAAGAVALILLSGLTSATWVERELTAKSFSDPVVYYEFSPYQQIVITSYQDDVRLYLNNNLQFSTLDEARYHELMAHTAMTSAPSVQKVLILGGGDGLLSREVLKYEGVEQVIVVDLDSAVTDLARTSPLLNTINGGSYDDERVEVVNKDALAFLESSDSTFDVVLADLVDPSNEKTAKLYSEQMYRAIDARLENEGVFVTQATSTFFTPVAFWTVNNSVAAGFGQQTHHWFVNIPTFGEWGFVGVAKNGFSYDRRDLPDDMRYVSSDVLSRSEFAPPELDRAEHDETSTLLSPTIHRHYDEQMKAWVY